MKTSEKFNWTENNAMHFEEKKQKSLMQSKIDIIILIYKLE